MVKLTVLKRVVVKNFWEVYKGDPIMVAIFNLPFVPSPNHVLDIEGKPKIYLDYGLVYKGELARRMEFETWTTIESVKSKLGDPITIEDVENKVRELIEKGWRVKNPEWKKFFTQG